MTKESFQKAKMLMDDISALEAKQNQVSLMKERENDEEFKKLRHLAYEGLTFAIRTLEKEFAEIK